MVAYCFLPRFAAFTVRDWCQLHETDDFSVIRYFQNQNLWDDKSMFRGVRQLEAGRLLVDEGPRRRRKSIGISPSSAADSLRRRAADMLRDVLDDVIDRQIAADVPVMAYLSGGIDSSSLVAGAHRRDPAVRAYSCTFDLDGVGEDRQVDEREFSRLVAQDLGIELVELELPQTTLASELLPTIEALEEPRMGMAYVNYMIAGRVAQDSKVVLSGCGGDEMLGGYVGRYGYLGNVGNIPGTTWWNGWSGGTPVAAPPLTASCRCIPIRFFLSNTNRRSHHPFAREGTTASKRACGR